MSIPPKDSKILWGRAGAKCSICKRSLTANKKSGSGEYVKGHQAHIVGEEEKAARGKSILGEKERNSYPNLILLCTEHHNEIDNDEETFPVEVLHLIKVQHESWVEDRLSIPDRFRQAQDEIYADIIQATADYCMFAEWTGWTSWVLTAYPRIKLTAWDNLGQFIHRFIRAPLSGQRHELECALETLSTTTEHFRRVFQRNTEFKDEWLIPLRPSLLSPWEEQQRASELISEWQEEVFHQVTEMTKAANWLCSVVRAQINPMFFAKEGKLAVTEGPTERFDTLTYVPEFTRDEQAVQPQKSKSELAAFEAGNSQG